MKIQLGIKGNIINYTTELKKIDNRWLVLKPEYLSEGEELERWLKR